MCVYVVSGTSYRQLSPPQRRQAGLPSSGSLGETVMLGSGLYPASVGGLSRFPHGPQVEC